MKYPAAFALSALCLLASTAAAQTVTTQAGAPVVGATIAPGAYSVSVSNMPLGSAITGAPYSAEREQEHVQTLADGTRIAQNQPSQKMWRDSQGRTRTERPIFTRPQPAPDAPPVPTMVEIADPVQGVRWVLDSNTKIAHRATAPIGAATTEVRNAAGQAVTPGIASSPPAVALAPIRVGNPQFASEDLGMQMIEGVTAQGRRHTTTYPIGAFGNDRPVVTTTEVWTSTDLHVIVLQKTSDPRSGETTVRLTKISRAEPDPALFQPSPDYTIEEETGNTISIRSGMPPPAAR